MLKKPNTSESAWQQFLQNYILLFNTAYVGVLEKMSVMLQGKYPDFMLLENVYNYIDIFEIKKPSTNLLKKDESSKQLLLGCRSLKSQVLFFGQVIISTISVATPRH